MNYIYKNDECIVASVDILGASKKINEDSEKFLNQVHSAYDAALNTFEYICKELPSPPSIRIFSDNIVVCQPCKDISIKKATLRVVLICALIQEKLLSHNILVRGGIAKGDFFMDEIMVWGKGLVKAHELEQTIAIFPRIILHPELVGEIEYHKLNQDIELKKILYSDYDDLVYIDCLNEFFGIQKPLFRIYLHLEFVENEIIKYRNNLKVIQKLLWHRNYLLRKLEELSDKSDEKTSMMKKNKTNI